MNKNIFNPHIHAMMKDVSISDLRNTVMNGVALMNTSTKGLLLITVIQSMDISLVFFFIFHFDIDISIRF